jgi:hypothetical protein
VDPRDVDGEPVTVPEGNEAVLPSVPEHDGNVDLPWDRSPTA